MAGKTFKIGAGISLDGEKEFRQAITNINQDIRVLDSEMKKVSAEFDDNGRSVKDLAAKQDVLGRQMLNQITKVQEARKALQAMAREYGEADKRTKDWQITLNKAEAELAQTRRELEKTTKELNEYGNEAKQAGAASGDVDGKSSSLFSTFKSGASSVAGVTGAMIGFAVAIYQQVKVLADYADELKRLSSELGFTTDQLQELQYIGDDVGVSLDTIGAAIKRLIANMDTAKTGSGEAYDSFQALGVSFRDSAGQLRDSEVVFSEIIDALGKISNETERSAIAQDLLGKSATELNPLLEAGGAAMKDLAKEAHDANAVMSQGTIDALDTAGDRLDHWWQILKATTGEAIVAIGNWLNGQEAATGASLDTLTSLGDKIDEIKANYDAVAKSAKDSLSEQIGLWENMTGTATKSLGDLKVAISSQIVWLESYNTNLSNLNQRHIEGLDELVLKLSDGTKESAAVVAGLASASDAEIGQLIDNMNEVEDRESNLARQLAEIRTNTMEQLNSIYSGMKDTAKDQLDASREAAQAAENTMNSYIAGIRSKGSEVAKAFREIFGAAAGNNTANFGYQPTGNTGGSSASIKIQPGTAIINLEGRQIARVTFPFNVEESTVQGSNLII